MHGFIHINVKLSTFISFFLSKKLWAKATLKPLFVVKQMIAEKKHKEYVEHAEDMNLLPRLR